MTPELTKHLQKMQNHALFIGTLIDAIHLGVGDPARLELTFSMLDAVGDMANELNIGLDSNTLGKVSTQ